MMWKNYKFKHDLISAWVLYLNKWPLLKSLYLYLLYIYLSLRKTETFYIYMQFLLSKTDFCVSIVLTFYVSITFCMPWTHLRHSSHWRIRTWDFCNSYFCVCTICFRYNYFKVLWSAPCMLYRYHLFLHWRPIFMTKKVQIRLNYYNGCNSMKMMFSFSLRSIIYLIYYLKTHSDEKHFSLNRRPI